MTKRKLVFAVIIFVIFIIIFVGGMNFIDDEMNTYQRFATQTLEEGAQEDLKSFYLEIGEDDPNPKTLAIIEDDSLFEALKSYKDTNPDFVLEYSEFEGLGAMITKIGNLTPSENEFIKLVINESDASVGPSMYRPEEGDIVMFVVDEIEAF